jgi:hypothetical protein
MLVNDSATSFGYPRTPCGDLSESPTGVLNYTHFNRAESWIRVLKPLALTKWFALAALLGRPNEIRSPQLVALN